MLQRKQKISTGRRRILESKERPSSILYDARRTDEELNTGRSVGRKITERIVRSKRAIRAQRLLGIAIIIVVIALVINLLSLSSQASVMPESTDASGLFTRNQATYTEAVQQLLQKSIWNQNKITINAGAISAQMISKFPEMTDVSVALPIFGHKPTIYIQIARPALILEDTSGAYVLDSEGKVLTQNVSSSSFNSLNLPTITDLSGLKLTRNSEALTSGDVTFIGTVISELSARKFTVQSMDLPAVADELDVHIVGLPYYVKFNLESGDARQQAGTFLATQSSLASQSITPTKYIDVRLDGRAYYL
jgi:hypothetical protein